MVVGRPRTCAEFSWTARGSRLLRLILRRPRSGRLEGQGRESHGTNRCAIAALGCRDQPWRNRSQARSVTINAMTVTPANSQTVTGALSLPAANAVMPQKAMQPKTCESR
jgi:hypothetical protein